MAKRKSMAGGEIIRDAQIYDVAVIGGGAAGCMAACAASENGARTLILEANDRIGRKMTGSAGRSVPQATDAATLQISMWMKIVIIRAEERTSPPFLRGSPWKIISVSGNQGEFISTTETVMSTRGQIRRLRSQMPLTKYCALREQRSSPEAGLSR